MITRLTSREFNQDASGAKKAANDGPVIITDRGKPAHVLLSIKDYQRLTGNHNGENIVDLLAMPDSVEIEFEAPILPGKLFKPADLS